MKKRYAINIGLIVAGFTGVIFCRFFDGAGILFFENHGANIFFPFAVFFIIRNFNLDVRTVTLLAVGGVVLQELAQLWGMYAGRFDLLDLILDLAGVIFALMIDQWALKRKPEALRSLSQ